jgi:hypothetical protein
MRQSGTLQSPTTGSIATLVEEAEREDRIAAARRIPKDVVVQLPDAAPLPTYVPAAKANVTDQANTATNKTDSASVQPITVAQNVSAPPTQQPTAPATAADSNRAVAALQPDAMPQPKSAAVSTNQTGTTVPTTDVATALKTLVSAPTNVATTNLSAKQETVPTLVNDQPSAKSEPVTVSPKPVETLPNVLALSLEPENTELKLGEKRQLALQVRSDAPLGLAVVTLRFDPKVLKINAASIGSAFANAKTAPTLTQSMDEHGMMLLSLAPAAGSTITANGVLLNLDVEAVGEGDSTLAFDLSNIHFVASDGRALLLQVEPVKLTVKQ